MKQVLVILLLFVWGISSSQTTYINECEYNILPILDKIKAEYKYNNITSAKFHQLDTIILKQLDYPDVGIWKKSGIFNNIYLLKWLCNHPLELEYTLKHELGHMHKVSHDTVNSKDMMYKYYSPPTSREELDEMSKKYYEDLKKLNPNKPNN